MIYIFFRNFRIWVIGNYVIEKCCKETDLKVFLYVLLKISEQFLCMKNVDLM